MSDENLDDLLDLWIAKQTAWSLHDAICLLQKINPERQKDPIVLDTDDGLTTRPFRLALKSLKAPGSAFYPLDELPDQPGAKRYLVDRDAFIEWADSDKWGGSAEHLVEAQMRYRAKKGTLSKTQQEAHARRVAHRKVFDRLLREKGRDKFIRMSSHKIAAEMQPIIEREIGQPYKDRRLRDLISKWIQDI
jgi:hypothetical protein